MRRYDKIFYADLETTKYKGQEKISAWSSAIGGGDLNEPLVFTNLDDTWKWIKKQKGNLLIYYHNLKFDGTFWVDYFLRNKILQQGLHHFKDGHVEMVKEKYIHNGEFIYNINNKGVWYNIIIKQNCRVIEFRDSLKLLPFPLRKIGEDFKTEHQKLEMDYNDKPEGYLPTKEELDYIKNDIYVLKEGVEVMLKEGHNRLTIGSCCMHEFKHSFGLNKEDYAIWFPNLYKIPLPDRFFNKPVNYGKSVGEYILNAYRGAWCYVNPRYQGRKLNNGFTLDVTSLYPSVMHSKSGNYYPVGKPKFWEGNYIPDLGKRKVYYYVRFRCAFTIKPGKLPFVQIKNDWRYKATEHLRTNALYNKRTGKYHKYTSDGQRVLTTMTMSQDEFELFKEHYDIEEFEILDGCYFTADMGMFDDYIDHYFKLKSTSKGARKSVAKLFLNNLYGKFATSPDSSYKVMTIGEDNCLHYHTIQEFDKEPGYIPIGAAITAKARCFTIRAAQANIERFAYADTDSIHCIGKVEQAVGVKIADNELCTWKHESDWSEAFFTRQKTYLERIDGKLQVKCAGMPERCKDLFISAVDGVPIKNLNEEEKKFLKKKKTMNDFVKGLKIPSKLYSKMLPGGTLLYEDYYVMH